jgi:hypothetical protein
MDRTEQIDRRDAAARDPALSHPCRRVPRALDGTRPAAAIRPRRSRPVRPVVSRRPVVGGEVRAIRRDSVVPTSTCRDQRRSAAPADPATLTPSDHAARRAPAILLAGMFRSVAHGGEVRAFARVRAIAAALTFLKSALRALPAAGRIPRPAATSAGILLGVFFPPVAPIAASSDRTDAGLRGTFHVAIAGFQATGNRPGRAVLRWPPQAMQRGFKSCFPLPRIAVWPRLRTPVFHPSEAPKPAF